MRGDRELILTNNREVKLNVKYLYYNIVMSRTQCFSKHLQILIHLKH